MIKTTLNIIFFKFCKVYLKYVIVHRKEAFNLKKNHYLFFTICKVYFQYVKDHKKLALNVIKPSFFHVCNVYLQHEIIVHMKSFNVIKTTLNFSRVVRFISSMF